MSPRQLKFCCEYLRTGNATQSYIAAGYKVTNDNSAAAAAARLLRDVKVAEYLAKYQKQVEDDAIASIDEVQRFWSELLRGDFGDDAEMRDRIKASELLVKSRGGFVDKVEMTGDALRAVEIRFVDKSKPRKGKKAVDPKIVGDYTAPIDVE